MNARVVLLASASVLALACSAQPPQGTATAAPGTGSPTPPAASESATAGTSSSAIPATTPPAGSGSIGGPGDTTLFDLASGLSEIQSYNATLTRSFDGSKDSAPVRWSVSWTMARSRAAATAELNIVVIGDSAPYESRHAWEVGGDLYEEDEAGCNPLSGPSDLDQAEPASLLTGVIGAQSAGDGHYTFDERALGLANVAHSTGEMWVGADSYVTRYELTTQGGAEYFGAGTDGTLTISYQLTGINEPQVIQLPAGCAVIPVEQVLMADASHVITAPGLIQYTTAASIDDVLAFYQAAAPGHGWTLIGAPITNGGTAGVLEFTTTDGQLTVFATADEGGTTVALSTDQQPAP